MRQPNQGFKIPKFFTQLLNHLYEAECRARKCQDGDKVVRNIERMKDVFLEDFESLNPGNIGTGLIYEDPMGQVYDDTRNDLDAHIAGTSTENLVVVDVIKPVIRVVNQQQGISHVVQKGIVTVESLKQGE